MTTFEIGSQTAGSIQNVGGDLTIGHLHVEATWSAVEVRRELARAQEEARQGPARPTPPAWRRRARSRRRLRGRPRLGRTAAASRSCSSGRRTPRRRRGADGRRHRPRREPPSCGRRARAGRQDRARAPAPPLAASGAYTSGMGVAYSSPDSQLTRISVLYRCRCGAAVSEVGRHAGELPPGWEPLPDGACMCAHCVELSAAASSLSARRRPSRRPQPARRRSPRRSPPCARAAGRRRARSRAHRRRCPRASRACSGFSDALSPSSAPANDRARRTAASAASERSPPRSSTIRPGAVRVVDREAALQAAQTTSTSPPPRPAAATASRLSRLPTSTVSAPAGSGERIARVPFVVVRISVSPRGSTYSRGEFPRSKPGTATAFRSPPSTASPSCRSSARPRRPRRSRAPGGIPMRAPGRSWRSPGARRRRSPWARARPRRA